MSQPISAPLPALCGEYLRLCKPRIVAMIVFTAMVGMLMATPAPAPLPVLLFASLGIALAAASSAVVNHIADLHIDAVMERTRGRPLPQGRIGLCQAGVFALALAAASVVVLTAFTNLLTVALTLLSLVGYGFVYTSYLKRATPQNIVIGGAAGAAPPVLGWCAVTGAVDFHALLLFLIVFAWTPPHFWALAIYRLEDYANARVPMLPVTHGVAFTRLHILLYAVLTVVVSLFPVLTYLSGMFYLAAAVPLGGGFLYLAWRIRREGDKRAPMRLFSYSIYYLLLLFAALLIDHYLPWPVGAAAPLAPAGGEGF